MNIILLSAAIIIVLWSLHFFYEKFLTVRAIKSIPVNQMWQSYVICLVTRSRATYSNNSEYSLADDSIVSPLSEK